MKDPLNRTKVVLRHLPPSLPQSSLLDQIDSHFSGRYKWLYFRPGKTSLKHQKHSRAYVDFKTPEDVVEFAEVFDGHLFVNERGSQFKVLVEYAPSQRVPKQWSRKDGREGTIFKDPEYVEFLELLARPVENLPSAEIQLERREAERAGAAKETLVVTPLMDFVRQKRAAKGGSQRLSSNGKLSRRSVGAASGKSSSASTRRGSEKRRVSTSMYVLRASAKNANVKEKSTYILVPREDEMIGNERWSGDSVSVDPGKKKILLLRGKEREIVHMSGGVLEQQSVTSPVKSSPGLTALKQSQRREASGRVIRSILSNTVARQNQSSTVFQSEQKIQTLNLEKVKRPPRPTYMRSVVKDHLSTHSHAAWSADCDEKKSWDDKIVGNDLHILSSINEKQEKRTRNRDRSDRGVWTLRRSDGSDASDDPSSSLATNFLADSFEGTSIIQHVEIHAVENGSHRHSRRAAHGVKDVNGSLNLSEGKPSKKGGATAYGFHEVH
ncbi:Regulator of nonsense-mediated decay [Macleaya cordata]|uniref:Regulator of nonsense-mediated decay n=1 Tax=Macleaya cordata TaxID=56857 RepID=A0A200R0T8_MACCD|nr:Regulator of nonsense-mediated decay [Macleaya cordata]